jgi:hypothetical protein
MTLKVLIKWKPGDAVKARAAAAAFSEHRFHQRLPVKYKFSIYASDPTAGQRYILARGINMSKSGALVETEEPIRVGSLVYVKARDLALMGSASVRHCNAKGSKFRIGLHFPSPLTRCL